MDFPWLASRMAAVDVNIKPTIASAALAGIVSAIAWPFLWARYGTPASSGSIELVVATLLVVALPAHAFVIGFRPSAAVGASAFDTALLKRVGAWLVAAAVTAGVGVLARS